MSLPFYWVRIQINYGIYVSSDSCSISLIHCKVLSAAVKTKPGYLAKTTNDCYVQSFFAMLVLYDRVAYRLYVFCGFKLMG